ncbi:YlaH-like family protein [Tuberibacillus sp. Marseille-P3662]|uniref:YlaH-like family protein n=1 Tax=Tuberibacillus sp. Marseille-P3662 TaxID=1965358 RepID=UPI000A1CEEC2|nr:YlaH-like family protein [Tuberibacillus sp. Marseille-P3662]
MITTSDLAPYPRFLFENPVTDDVAFYLLWATIFVLSIIVYKLGFARKLPVLKAAIIYCLMFFGCFMLAILALQLPITGALFFSTLVLTIYKIRLKKSKQKDASRQV